MRRDHYKEIFFVVMLMFFTAVAHAGNFYVDAVKGSDNNPGKLSAPWKTLRKVSSTIFKPGDIILFRSGQHFIGTLIISSSGANTLPIVYTTYGGTVSAIIDGNGDSTAMYCYNKEYIELKNLAFTNYRKGLIGINDLFTGINIINNDAGTLHHFRFDRIKVFNVNSTFFAKDEGKTDQSRYYGGVLFQTLGNKIRSNFDDVLVMNSTFENLSRTGFNFRSDWDDRAAYSKFGDSIGKGIIDNWTPNTRIVFRKNVFKNIAGNGLIVRVAVNALIEHNLFDSCGKFISGNAVFNFNTDNTIYQFNEAKNTIYNEGETDARGIDADYRTKGTIIQYNYLHDNGLGGVTATGGPGVGANPLNFNSGTIIRYNIIENNARQGAYFSGRVEGLQVYNNVFFADERFDSVAVVKFNRWTVYPSGACIANNIFSFKGFAPYYIFTQAINISFDHNLYDGVKPPEAFPDKKPLQASPAWQNAGDAVNRYKLTKISPAINAGVPVSDNASKDYYGNVISAKSILNIGIDNSKFK